LTKEDFDNSKLNKENKDEKRFFRKEA